MIIIIIIMAGLFILMHLRPCRSLSLSHRVDPSTGFVKGRGQCDSNLVRTTGDGQAITIVGQPNINK